MGKFSRGRAIALIATAVVIVSSCGGGDDGATSEPLDSTEESSLPSVVEDSENPPVEDTNVPVEGSQSPPVEDTDAPTTGDGTTIACDAIFSIAEIEEFFGEPVTLDEQSDADLGQLVCDWESIEDPTSTDDLAYKLLVLQFYSGTPIDGSMFVDPSIFESVTTIDGVGDLAFSPDELGTSYFFVDGQVAGTLDYSEADMGNADAPRLRTAGDVEQLFRTFHDRVT